MSATFGGAIPVVTEALDQAVGVVDDAEHHFLVDAARDQDTYCAAAAVDEYDLTLVRHVHDSYIHVAAVQLVPAGALASRTGSAEAFPVETALAVVSEANHTDQPLHRRQSSIQDKKQEELAAVA